MMKSPYGTLELGESYINLAFYRKGDSHPERVGAFSKDIPWSKGKVRPGLLAPGIPAPSVHVSRDRQIPWWCIARAVFSMDH